MGVGKYSKFEPNKQKELVAELKDVAKVHERLVSQTGSPPRNGGVEFDEKGNVSGLTFGNDQISIDVQWHPNDK